MLLFSCCGCIAHAQQFSFKLTTKDFAETDIVYLQKYHGRDELVIDSVKGNRSATITINTTYGIEGLYFLSAGRNASAEFILNSTEKINIEVSKGGLENGRLGISGSNENEAYEKFVTRYLAYDSAFYRTATIKVDEFDALLITRLKKKTNDMLAIEQGFISSVDALERQYPGTYTVKVLGPLAAHTAWSSNAGYDNYPAFLFHHFWDKASFAYPSVLNHFLLNEQLKNYFRYFVPKNQDSIKVAIDLVLSKTAASPDVNAHVNSFLLRNFLKSNAEELVLYVNSKNTTEACGLNLSPTEMKKFEALKSLSVGATVPDAFLNNLESNKVSLKTTAAAHKVTVVLFWASHCGKCRAELPYLKELYQKYKAQGLEVYAINIDENKFNWREAVQEFGLTWINVTDEGRLKDSKLLAQFNIQHTPSLFVIDAKGAIVDKEVYGTTLGNKLAELLGK